MLGALGIVGWVIFRASLGKMLTLIHRKRTLGCFLFEGRGSGLRGVFAGHWCEHRVPLRLPGWMTVNPPSLGPGAAAPRSQTSPPPEVMPSVLPLIKAAFQARKKKKKKKISLPSCWIYCVLTDLGAGQLLLPPMLLNHSWETLGSALAGEGLGKQYLLELSPFVLRL